MVKDVTFYHFAWGGSLKVPVISGSNMVTRTSAISGIRDSGMVTTITYAGTLSMRIFFYFSGRLSLSVRRSARCSPSLGIGSKASRSRASLGFITTPNRELCVFQELRKIGFCDYQNVFSRNEEKVNFIVPPI